MPAGAVPLLEAARGTESVLKQGFVNTILRHSGLAEMIPWMQIQSDSIKHQEEVDLPNPQFRKVYATYSKSWGRDAEYYWGVTILGGEVSLDNYLINVMGNKVGQKANQYGKWAKAIALTLDKQVVDGTGTADDFKGFNQIVTDGRAREFVAGANGAAITIDMLDEAIDLSRGVFDFQFLAMNRTMRRRINKLGRDTSLGYPLIDVGTDRFGRQITSYGGLPIAIVEDDRTGSPILDFDETQGGSSATTSLYMVSTGDMGVTGLLGGGGHMDVLDFGEQQASPTHLGRVEFYPGLAVFNPYSLVRIKGVTNA
jgi:hypothetical protein